jgi:hypothetical protein
MTQIAIRFPNTVLDAVDAIVAHRAEQPERFDRPDRSGVLRELVAEALSARGKRS